MPNLLTKQRHNRAGGFQHVAETHHREANCVGRALQCLQSLLGQAFGGTHDVGRADGLISRHENEILHAGTDGRLGRAQRAENVVARTLDNVLLDHRHMLVGRCVIDRINLKALHDFLHAKLVLHRTQQRHDITATSSFLASALQFLVNLVERDLRNLE